MQQSLTTYLDFIKEDKGKYQTANSAGYFDPDNDFLIGESGGFVMNMNFTFIDTDLLRPSAIYYETNKSYTSAKTDSIEHKRFTNIEEDRRRNGFTAPCKLIDGKVHNLRITGEHYNLLNYGRMLRVETVTNRNKSRTAIKVTGFPRFFSYQYWWCKVKEFARNNGFNVVLVKSRRSGITYIEAIDTANRANLTPDVTYIYAAYDKKYLIDGLSLSPMTLNQLTFYEEHTPFTRGMLSRNFEEMELGYKKIDGTRTGYQSKIYSVSFGPNNPDAAIGKDAVEIKIEELSNAPNLDAFLRVTEPTTRAGAYVTGTIIGWGTSGSKEGSWAEFETWFNNPKKWNAMPFENVWDENMRHTTCGFYKPYIENLEGKCSEGTYAGYEAMDKNGNTLYPIAIALSNEERKKKRESSSDSSYLAHCGQYSNCPSESFGTSIENMFTTPELNIHIERLKTDPDLRFHRDGIIVRDDKGVKFQINDVLATTGNKIHPYITDVPIKSGQDIHGCIRQWYTPFKIDSKIPDNLYRIWYDPVDIQKDISTATNRTSLAAFYVYMRSSNLVPHAGGMIVASYCGRMNNLDDIDRLVLDTAEYYNAKILHENDRGDLIRNAKIWGMLKYLAFEPSLTWDKTLQNKNSHEYGFSMSSTERKTAGLLYYRDWLYEVRSKTGDNKKVLNLHYVYDLPLLLETRKYTGVKNLDRFSAMLIGMFDIKECIINDVKAKISTPRISNSIWEREWFK